VTPIAWLRRLGRYAGFKDNRLIVFFVVKPQIVPQNAVSRRAK
jgi:hypothetical protein